MKIIAILMVLASGMHSLQAQSDGTQKRSKLSWGISIASGLSFRSLQYVDMYNHLKEYRNRTEQPIPGYQIGMLSRRSVGKKAGIELGIFFSAIGYQTQKQQLSWNSDSPDFANETKLSQQFQLLGLRLRYLHKIINKKCTIYLAPGISIDELLNRKTVVTEYFENGRNRTSSKLRTGFSETYLNGVLSIGSQFQLSSTFSVCIEPTYIHGFTSTSIKNSNKERLYLLGCNFIFLYSRK